MSPSPEQISLQDLYRANAAILRVLGNCASVKTLSKDISEIFREIGADGQVVDVSESGDLNEGAEAYPHDDPILAELGIEALDGHTYRLYAVASGVIFAFGAPSTETLAQDALSVLDDIAKDIRESALLKDRMPWSEFPQLLVDCPHDCAFTEFRVASNILRAIIKCAPDSIIVADRHGKLCLKNSATDELFKRAGLDLTTGEKYPNLNEEEFESYFKRVIANPHPQKFETQYIGAAKVPVHIVVSLAPLLDNDGQVSGVVGVLSDVTELKRAEEKFRAESDFSYAVLETLSALVIVVDRSGRVLRFNRACEELSGFTFAEIQERTVFEALIPEEERAGVFGVIEGHFKGEEFTRSQNHWITRDGKRRLIEWSSTVLFDDTGIAEYVIGTGMDVTERVAMNRALRENKQRLDLALNGAELGLWDWDIKSDVTTYNERWSAMLGYTQEPLYTSTADWERLVHPEDLERVSNLLYSHLRGEIPFYEAEYRLQTRDGGYKWILDRGKVVERDAEGNPLRAAGTHLDISSQKNAEIQLRNQQRFLTNLMSNLPGMVYQCENDPDWTIFFVSDGCETITGYRADELIRDHINFSGIIHPEDLALTWGPVQKALDEKRPFELTYRMVTKSGEIKWVWEQGVGVWNEQGELQHLEGFITDISNLREAQEALRASEQRYALAAAGANDGLWDWDIQNNRVYFAPRWKDMLGFRSNEVTDDPAEWFDRIHPEDRNSVEVELKRHIEGATAHFQSEHRILHADQTYRWVLCRGLAVFENGKEAVRMAGSLSDITDKKIAEEQLLHDAFHDSLTNLPNRAYLLDRMGALLQKSRREPDYSFAVIFMDIDRFKNINDSMGHVIGDRFLVEISSRLKNSLRETDTMARFGGDEFMILLDGLNGLADVSKVAEKMQSIVSAPVSLEGRDVVTTASMGIALSSLGYERPDEMLRDSDTALHRAKSSGRAKHLVFDRTMHHRVRETLELENDLHRAIERNELVLHYQPIALLSTRRLHACEALIRWNHPTRGLLLPNAFVPLAEETGQILSIGSWVVKEACRQIKLWDEELGPLAPQSVSVNLSGRRFISEMDGAEVPRILTKEGVDPSRIKLEITESVLLEDPDRAVDQLQWLRDLGFSIHLDDFGTGYCSLKYLMRFPIDVVKIDKSFVTDMMTVPRNKEIVRSIIYLAKNINISVTAEGVESGAVLSELAELGCDHAQGYHLSRPMDGDAMARLCREDKRFE